MKLSRDIEGVAKTTRLSSADRETKVINLLGKYLADVKLKRQGVRENHVEISDSGENAKIMDLIAPRLLKVKSLQNKGLSNNQVFEQITRGADKNVKRHISNIMGITGSSSSRGKTDELVYDFKLGSYKSSANVTKSRGRRGPTNYIGTDRRGRHWYFLSKSVNDCRPYWMICKRGSRLDGACDNFGS